MEPQAMLLITSVASTALITCWSAVYLTRFSLRILSKRKRGYEQIDAKVYEDEDGRASEESQANYSAKFQKACIVIASLMGAFLSLIIGIKSTLTLQVPVIVEQWLYFGSWMLIAIRGICISFEHSHLQVFYSATQLAGVALVFLIAQIVVAVLRSGNHGRTLDIALFYGQTLAAFIVFQLSIMIPRRPDVFANGRKVDGMRSVSLFSRFTFHWISKTLKRAFDRGQLEENELPVLDKSRTAEYLLKAFNEVRESPKLHVQIILAHWRALAVQWSLTIIECAFALGPQLAMFKILKNLEKRNAGIDIGYELWFWVGGLVLIEIAGATLRANLYWMCFSSLMIPVRSQLSALVFAKTMRKKDVKGLQKGKEENDKAEDAKGKAAEDEEDDLKMLKQGTINLIAVDSSRIADLCAFNNIFPETFFSLLFGLFFIIYLIGWRSLAAGILVIVVTTPLNVMVSNKYAAAQDNLMKVRDRKMALVSEALQGIRQIKFSALETQWENKLRKVRDEELSTLRKVYITSVTLIFFWIANPVLLAVVALGTYSVINGTLKPSVAFTALSLFSELEFVLSIVPELTTDLLDAYVSSKRIKEYLDSPEKKTNISDSKRIAINNATIAWAADSEDEKDRFCLRDINLEFPINELSIISGRTGSGKSLLLAALLGEADVLSGDIEMPRAPNQEDRFDHKSTPANWIIPSAVAFVAQIPWIENATIKDNILFGMPYNEARYRKTLYACALEKDLEMLPDGELTEIGANGINLSGGQRWRVSFARAVYSRAGILILDDIFSAVDAHVGKHIFVNGLTGELVQGRTRILVTHHIKLCLSEAKYTVCLNNGTIQQAGFVEDLRKEGGLEDLLSQEEQLMGQDDAEDILQVDGAVGTNGKANGVHIAKPRQFVQDEKRAKGAVNQEIYRKYLSASGGLFFWLCVMLSFSLQEIIHLSRSYWLKLWTSSYTMESFFAKKALVQYTFQRISTVVHQEKTLAFWIGIYTALSIAMCFIGVLKYVWVILGSLRASRVLFEKMTATIMRTPLRWLDTVPTGRILNRFSKDFETLDSNLANDIAFMVYHALALVGVIAAGLFLSPWMLLMAVILISVNLMYALFYLVSAREVKRLESNSRSPIFELFGSTLNGVATIRAFGKTQEYIDKMFEKLDVYGQRTYYQWLFNRWMGYRVSLVGAIFSGIVAAIIVMIPEIDASLAGFAMTFALSYTSNIIWTLRRYVNMELDMNSTERILEYTELPTEDMSGMLPPAGWPHEGRMEVEDLVVAYAPDLPPVLKGISFKVEPRQRVGVVGRTGAGKSSLTLAIFQFIRASSGSINIDGLDISKVSLHELRSRLAIIPQDPVLFSGTVRSNLDAFDEHTDQELREALERVHLTKSITDGSETPHTSSSANANIFESLDSKVSEGGLNLSQGQRQLLCLARAIVSRPKILVLDEATSAVDMETDALIQKSIREEFTDCTTLVIAHRLHTVADYDRILVLGDGKVLEYDTPWNLIQSKGTFYDMVQQSGESEALVEISRKAAGA